MNEPVVNKTTDIIQENQKLRESVKTMFSTKINPKPSPPRCPLVYSARYWHPDSANCTAICRSPNCHECFRYFCPICKNGVGGMYSQCRVSL